MKNFFSRSFTRLLYSTSKLTRRIWFRAFLYGMVGVLTAFAGLFAHYFIPSGTVSKVGSDAVGNILSILASSMLTVATFSLSIMVTAFGNVSSGATPRASRLLIENQSAQRAVATFIGAFLYSIVGIIALTTGAYGEQGRFVLFAITIVVIVVIVVTLIKWVDQLSTLGRIGHVISQVETATLKALQARVDRPHLGASPLPESFPKDHILPTESVGFISFIDMAGLQQLCEAKKLKVHVAVSPGSFAYPSRPLAFLSKAVTESELKQLSAHFIIEPSRTFDQDPRFGFVLLSEIASRALSKAVNDPGTVIEVVGSSTRILKMWSDMQRKAKSENQIPVYPHLYAPDVTADDFLDHLILPIVRDGSNSYEIGTRLLRMLESLQHYDASLFAERATFYESYVRTEFLANIRSEFERTRLLDCSMGVGVEN